MKNHRIYLFMIVATKATTCYGCKERVRNTPSEPPPQKPLIYSSVRAKRKSGLAKHQSLSTFILCVHVHNQHRVWTSNWRSLLWQDCQIQISSFCGVNSVFDSTKGRQIFFCVCRQNLHNFFFLDGYFRTFFTENVLFRYLRYINISYIFFT